MDKSDEVTRKGAWTKSEKEFMTANAFVMPVDKIAEQLGRKYEKVFEWIEKNVRQNLVKLPQGDVVHELKNSADWKRLTLELSPDELVYFQEQYNLIVQQFKEDIVYTERQQIFQFIKFDILMSRNLQSRLKAEQELEKISKHHAAWLGQFAGNPSLMQPEDMAYHQDCIATIERLKREIDGKSSEYKVLHNEHQSLTKNMKATRAERITKHNQDRGTFLVLLKELKEEERNNEVGRALELNRLSVNQKFEELGRKHKFVDGTMDYIITNVDTVREKYENE